MKITELLKNINDIKKSFVLGIIYGWTLVDKKNKHIFAYSSYKTGKKINKVFNEKPNFEEYYKKHKTKLKEFLGDEFEIELNSEIKNKFKFANKRIGSGISIIIENDLKNENNIDNEINILNKIEKELIESKKESKKFFLIGLMDSRGSLDFKANFISIDIDKATNPKIVRKKLSKFNDLVGLIFNYNPRKLQRNSSKKNDQFRLNLDYFMGNFGLLNPFKIDYYKKVKNEFKEKLIYDNFLFLDKNYLNMKLNKSYLNLKNLQINDLHQKIVDENLSRNVEKSLIENYRKENYSFLDTDEEILYSSQNIKNIAKINADFKCELDKNHKTFMARKDKKNYVEAHHLIPFSKRKDFKTSIDIEQNIVCLCPNCHRKIHLGLEKDITNMLKILYQRRKNSLKSFGITINLDLLKKYYHID